MVEERIITIKDIDYIVSSDGKVYSTNNCGRAKYHQEISQRLNADGYMQITVGKTGNRSQYRVHRMVAEAFIPNPDNLPEVNHKDNDRTNNCVDNLEWCTHEYNIQYSIDSCNHISTTDITGSNNPNYGNHVLSERYKDNPELAKENQSRPGSQNGRARKIKLIDTVEKTEIEFGYMRAAASYLIIRGFTKATTVDSVMNRLSMCAKSGKKYKKRFYVEFVD
jgi:hypothetical protein